MEKEQLWPESLAGREEKRIFIYVTPFVLRAVADRLENESSVEFPIRESRMVLIFEIP